MSEVLISLGSNVDKESNLPRAITRLARCPELVLVAISSMLETQAIGVDGQAAAQPGFYNAAVRAHTSLRLVEMRALLRGIEVELGRVRGGDKFAPRPIDLDLAYYGERALAETTGAGEQPLEPDVLRFAHVALPLAEVAPHWVHPQTGMTLAAIAATFAVQSQGSQA